MKLCAAQTRPVDGDIAANISTHLRLVELAVSGGAEVILFPELSVTGYDRALARELAVERDDARFEVFQTVSDAHRVAIAVGAPVRKPDGVCISPLIFQPGQARQMDSKMHLHSGEEAFYVPSPPVSGLIGDETRLALAICYEVTVPQHSANAARRGATTYLASVANTSGGIDKEFARLSHIAREHSMTVLMANCTGHNASWDWAGRTSVWTDQGAWLGQLDDSHEGILVFDTKAKQTTTEQSSKKSS